MPMRITSPARTVVDCFRYRNKLGLDIALEALRDALGRKLATGWRGSRCGDGGDGDNGGDGEDGGDGGDGGDVTVHLSCSSAPCERVADRLAGVIVSISGPGGSGGAGGAGGNGGAQQSPTTHTDSDGNTVVDDPGCSAGSNGSSGSSGANGSSGSDGRSGCVTF